MVKIKTNSIFALSEVLQYISYSIHDNIYKKDDPVNYSYWGVAFSNTYRDLRINNREVLSGYSFESDVNNLAINSVKTTEIDFFRNIFNIIFTLEEKGLIENSDIFIGTMLAWFLDPVRSFYTKIQREGALNAINLILDRYYWVIKYSNSRKKYIFERQVMVASVDKDAIYINNERVFITKGHLKYKKDNDEIEKIKTKPADIKILIFLISSGKANINNWFKIKDLATKLGLKAGTVSNSFSSFRGISKIIKSDLFEDRGIDSKGKDFRINPKVL